jgi:DNA-binding IclR family transcriptional regulator
LRRILSALGLRRFTRSTPTDVAAVEGELRAWRPGDVVIERGQFREDVACASIATPAHDAVGWWALGVSARGLDLPDPLLAHLRRAAADLRGMLV